VAGGSGYGELWMIKITNSKKVITPTKPVPKLTFTDILILILVKAHAAQN